MNTDMNQFDIQEMYGQNDTGSKKFLRNCELGFVFRSSLLSTALSLPTVICKRRNGYV